MNKKNRKGTKTKLERNKKSVKDIGEFFFRFKINGFNETSLLFESQCFEAFNVFQVDILSLRWEWG